MLASTNFEYLHRFSKKKRLVLSGGVIRFHASVKVYLQIAVRNSAPDHQLRNSTPVDAIRSTHILLHTPYIYAHRYSYTHICTCIYPRTHYAHTYTYSCLLISISQGEGCLLILIRSLKSHIQDKLINKQTDCYF